MNDNNIPDLTPESIPEFLQKDDWFSADVTPYYLDFTKPYEAPRYTLSWNGIGFAPLGGIHAMTGQAGNGKTMTLAQFIAAILGGEYGGLQYALGADVPCPKVLYIDTEMEESNTIAMKNRVLSMTGREVGEAYDDFKVVMLREVSRAVDRWRMTLRAIYDVRPTVAFIDGLLDVVEDFNSNKECAEIIYKCMEAASHYGISLWCLVHQNPGATKLVGHLGSMLERKVTDIFECSKEKNEVSGDVLFTVKQKKARGRDVPDWKFRVQPVNGWGVPEHVSAEVTVHDDPLTIKQWLSAGRNDIEWPATKTQIKEIFKTRGGQTHGATLVDDVTVAINLKYLVPQSPESRRKGQTYIKYELNPEKFTDEDPFLTPKEDVPF